MITVEVIPYRTFKEKIAITKEIRGKTVYIDNGYIITEEYESKEGGAFNRIM